MKPSDVKIAHISEAFSGGICTYFKTVLPALAAKGFDVTLICSLNRSCPDAAEIIAALEQEGVKVNVVPMSREIAIADDIRALVRLYMIFSRQRFDVVHTHCSKAGALGRVAAFLAGQKVILHTPHCFSFLRCYSFLRKKLYFYIERVLGKVTTQLVAVSKSEAGMAEDSHIVPVARCTVVYNSLAVSCPSVSKANRAYKVINKASFGINPTTRVVTTVCRLTKYKGVFRFLEAAERSEADNTVFLLAGDGELRVDAERFVRQHNLSDKIRLLGYVQHIEYLYAISDLIVLCSDAEGQPYTLLEAMRSKCAIVATSVPGNLDLISHNKTGCCVLPTASSIANAIDRLLADDSHRNRLTENAYTYFCQHHSLDKQISELASIYRRHASIVEEKRHSGVQSLAKRY